MKKNILFGMMVATVATLGFTSCSKSDNGSGTNITTASSQALTDFVNVLAEPTYADLVTKATTLNNAVQTLVATPTAANQLAAQNAWIDIRVTWEQSEGFLLGPVEDNNYDPNTDTWPTDKNQIDSLLTNTHTDITSGFLDNTDQALKGFHPLEYYLWDADLSKYTDAQKSYMTALSQNILDNYTALQSSWTTGGFANEVLNPGKTEKRYFTSKEDALEKIADVLIDICNEVGEQSADGKMYAPYIAEDSTITESPYSHNSVTDFTNNIQGALNTYTCSYNGQTGTSLSSLVQINNKNLDTKIKTAFNTVISSFSTLSGTTFEKAIYNNRPAVLTIINNIGALKALLEDQLVPYVQQYVKD